MSKKILIVDDDEGLLDLLESRLESWGYKVVQATDGNEGLEVARKISPDLIIMDIIMPHMDGYQFCLLLKSDPNLKDIPVIMLTSLNQKIDEVTGKALGALEYITKPFDSEKLKATIKRLL